MAFCAETLWAAALLSTSVVGSDLTARCGDARSSPPRLRPKSLAAGTLVVFKQALTPDNLRFEPEMTCYHVTITDASRPENRTSGTRRADPPPFWEWGWKEYNGRGYMLQATSAPDSKAVPLEPRFMGGYTAAQGLAALTNPGPKDCIPWNPAQPCASWIPPKLAALDWPRGALPPRPPHVGLSCRNTHDEGCGFRAN